MRPGRPVRGIVSPLSAGWFLMLSGVSPCAICQTMSPLFRSIAVMRAVRRLDQRQPLDGQAAAAAFAAAARRRRRRRVAPVRAAAGRRPEPPVRRAPVGALPWTKFMSDMFGRAAARGRAGSTPLCE